MDRLNRTDSQYLKLFTQEHGLLKLESKLISDYKLKEEEERSLFFNLSSCLRDAQEKERIRVERVKYLQLGLSVVCTSLGLLSAYLLNYFRNANIKEILDYDKEHFSRIEDSVKTILEKQEDFESNLESVMAKWKSNVNGVNEELLENEALVEENLDVVATNELNEADKKDYTNLYKNAILISTLFFISFIFYLNKNK